MLLIYYIRPIINISNFIFEYFKLENLRQLREKRVNNEFRCAYNIMIVKSIKIFDILL